MKNEDFDEAIRKKLEGLNQKYSRADIDKTMDHLHRKGAFSSGGFSGSALIYSLAAAAVVVGVVWTVLHFANPAKTKISATNPSAEINKVQVDTPMPTDSIEDQKETKKNIAEADNSGYQLPAQQAKAEKVRKSSNGPTPLRDDKETTASKKLTDPALLQNETSEKEHLVYSKQENFQEIVLSKTFTDSVKLHSEDAPGNTPADATGNPGITLQGMVKSAETNQTSPSAGSEATETIKVPAAVSAEAEAANDAPAKSAKTKRTGSLINGKLMIGSSFEYTRFGIGAGIDLGVKLPKRLIINTGLRYTNLNDELFANKSDFDRHDPKKRNRHFNDQLKHHDHIHDIVIHSNLIQIPLSAGYRIPLNKGYSFTFSLGTDLDVFLSQRLTFSQPPDSIKPPHGDLRDRANAVFFNNIVITGSIEKEYKRFALSLSPFIRPQLQKVFYKPKELDYGIALRLYFLPGH